MISKVVKNKSIIKRQIKSYIKNINIIQQQKILKKVDTFYKNIEEDIKNG